MTRLKAYRPAVVKTFMPAMLIVGAQIHIVIELQIDAGVISHAPLGFPRNVIMLPTAQTEFEQNQVFEKLALEMKIHPLIGALLIALPSREPIGQGAIIVQRAIETRSLQIRAQANAAMVIIEVEIIESRKPYDCHRINMIAMHQSDIQVAA